MVNLGRHRLSPGYVLRLAVLRAVLYVAAFRIGEGRVLTFPRTSTERAMIQGPMSGGRHGWPFNQALLDLAEGFVEQAAAA